MISRPLRSAALALAAALFTTFTLLPPALADIYVIESTAAGIRVGSRLAADDTIAVPSGAFIRAVLPSGKTQTIRGPYNGSLADFAKGQTQNEGVIAWLRNILQTGGATEATPGATRSIGREMPKLRAGFSWAEVPATMDATVCVDKSAKLQLVRAASSRAESVTVVDMASAERAEAQWAAGSELAPWPAAITPRPDGKYDLFMQNRTRRQITLRVLERLPADGDVLTELHKLGCKHQFEAWVRERLAAGKGKS
ncbi:MAG: hypothetical protein F9K29_00745 [Hyphomicrobiaceae bacterium]|nr:MAG: hypothetical protein F9K29_00745 [Hyphomicrobiaceae bacterium]